ncbi:MAG TPA: hypothetical protein VJ770_08330 [Stellaceae bacterium]|nr:hypothetical protein [Stellaceae bacterium]
MATLMLVAILSPTVIYEACLVVSATVLPRRIFLPRQDDRTHSSGAASVAGAAHCRDVMQTFPRPAGAP